jgi:hypothetical protein
MKPELESFLETISIILSIFIAICITMVFVTIANAIYQWFAN